MTPSTHTAATAPDTDARRRELVAEFIAFLETGVATDGLFAPDAFCDFNEPNPDQPVTWITR